MNQPEIAAHLVLHPQQARFDKPELEKHRYLKALFLKGFVDGKLMTEKLVDVHDCQPHAIHHVSETWEDS
jgi:hypothetical protein